MRVLVIDYGMGNLGSVGRTLQECGADIIFTTNPSDICKSEKIILPGVGAFPDGMAALQSNGWVDALKSAINKEDKHILGICLGMQLLATKSFEGKETEGLDLISGEVHKLAPLNDDTRIPHVGWNEVKIARENKLLSGIGDGTDFYFVHSFHFIPNNERQIIAKTPYCGEFVSAINSEKVYGVQFHPEKSSRAGLRLLDNFLRL